MPTQKYIAQSPLDGKMLATSPLLDDLLKLAPSGSVILSWIRYSSGGYEYSYVGIL